MGHETVLCHTFEHDGRWFCFDTATSHIYECDEVSADLAPVWNKVTDGPERQAADRKWGRERVQAALEEIRELNAAEQALAPRDLTIIHECACCSGSGLYESAIEHLQMTLTEQCNLRCEYCPYTRNKTGTRAHNDASMTQETALDAIEFFMARNGEKKVPVVSFYGGEPLLRFDLIREIVARLRSLQGDREVQLHLDTNGVLIDDAVAAYLAEEKFYVQISLDGPRHIHDRYRRTRGGQDSFDQVIAGLERLLGQDPGFHRRIRFNAVMAPPYEVKETVAFFADFPVYKKWNITEPPAVGLQFADVAGIDFKPRDMDENSNHKFQTEFAELRRQYLNASIAGKHQKLTRPVRAMFDKELTLYHNRSRTLLPDEVFPTGCCRPGQRKVHVKVDGSLMPCERCGDNMIIGHLDSGFDMPMIHNLYEKLVDSLAERCRKCWAVRHCGLCFVHMADHWQADGTADIVISEQMCEQTRARMDQVFKDYLTMKNAGPEGLDWLRNMQLV